MAQQKYSIIEKIDAGGMAEVWKGKASSLSGFEKLVAIKRVLPNLAKNKKFIAMFLDEARLALHLNHANIVHTFDIGVSENSYYIVMEFMDGTNLKSVMESVKQRGLRLPPEQAAYIGLEICKGLYHAHNRKDLQGRPLNIVHRDISPPNVLLSREGEVKLVDFGLAKAATQIALTDPGVVKGKFSYLSPEAAYGETVDARADIFATGIVLWEMLAGRRLFDGETDLKTVELVRKAEIPPLGDYNADVHPQLEAIILKSLAREPNKRHGTTVELAHELAQYLFSNRLMVTCFDISLLVKKVLAARKRPTAEMEPITSQAQAMQKIIEAEIGEMRSLEDLDRMEFRSVAQLDEQGDESDGLTTEDPRGWAADMGLDETELTPGLRPAGAKPPPPPPSGERPSGERTSGSRPGGSQPGAVATPMEPEPAPNSRVARPVGPPPIPPGGTPPPERNTGGHAAASARPQRISADASSEERQRQAAAAANMARAPGAPPDGAGAASSIVKSVGLGILGAGILVGTWWFLFK